MMKVGLLVTDNDPNYGGEYGIAESIKSRLNKIIPADRLEIIIHYVVNDDFPTNLEEFHGFIITGAHFSVNDDLEWIHKLKGLIVRIYHQHASSTTRQKLFGICFGHQLIAKALGGKIGRNPNGKFIWGSGGVNVENELSDTTFYKTVFGESKRFYIMQSHYEQILELPSTGKSVGKAPGGECDHEVVIYNDNILTMQGHPEVTVDRMINIALPYLKNSGKLTEAEQTIALESLKHENGDELVKLIYEFMKY